MDNTLAAHETARRGGVEIAAEANGLAANNSDVVRGVDAARPRDEVNLAASASNNGAGVSRTISNAENTSGDPQFEGQTPNYGAAEAQTRGRAGGIEGGGHNVSGRAGEGQALERELLRRGGI